ncbi:hypothetical protein [Thermococcus litoralis]|uniref:hypothetical protein n=1 Tax=Thermococcus litoralis TaxID=2265 RepID=UPI000B3576CB|nr:hypothetical protein [Thermococcus litoralis]
MRIILTAGNKWRRVVLEIPDDVFKKIQHYSEKYGFRVEEGIKIILRGDFLEEPEGDIEKLKEEVNQLQQKLYEIEGKWASLKFTSYGIAADNKNLAIQLSGLISENKRLRKVLRREEKDYTSIEKLIRYYLGV